MGSSVTSQQEGSGFSSQLAQPVKMGSVWRVQVSQCLCGFAPFSSHGPKTCSQVIRRCEISQLGVHVLP